VALAAALKTPAPAAAKAAADRQAFVNYWKKQPLFNGRLGINGKEYNVMRGVFVFEGKHYFVSKDGRAVIDPESNVLIGQVIARQIVAPSQAFRDWFVSLGAFEEV